MSKIELKPMANGQVIVIYIDKDGKPQNVIKSNLKVATKFAERISAEK